VEVGARYAAGLVTVSVSDSGGGISAAEVENIFERFVRFSKHNQGLGLGLSIAKAIVEAHGGQIVVESVQGQGSCFSFTLPAERLV
jgi:signal transduction histidine kinase